MKSIPTKIAQQTFHAVRAVFSLRAVRCLKIAWLASTFGTASILSVNTYAACNASIVEQWSEGFKVELTVSNDTQQAVDGWQVQWSWPEGTSFSQGWEASFACDASTCQASPPPWNPVLAAGQAHTFGFIGTKTPAQAVSNLAVSGALCGGTTPNEPALGWQLQAERSSLQYVSVKNYHIAETNTFGSSASPALDASISENGDAIIAIDLNKLDTGIEIRNTRMLDFVFETGLLPKAYITANVDQQALAQMAVGSVALQNINATLQLHAMQQALDIQAQIVKLSATQIAVSSLSPILVDSKQFDMASGVSVLQGIANLQSIGEAVPVYFHLVFESDSDVSPPAMPATPTAPASLEGEFDSETSEAVLSWLDQSSNESQFLVRRKTPLGLWATVNDLPANQESYREGLPEEGEFDYKVIALNNGVGSVASNSVRVIVTDGNPIERGRQIYEGDCAGCHGLDGSGSGNFPAINTPRDMDQLIEYITDNMPLGNPQACDVDCANDVAAYLQTLWVNEVRCDRSIAPVSYGARQLKILTRSEYHNSVRDLLGVNFDVTSQLSADEKIAFFNNNTHSSILASSYSNYLLVAEEVATWSADRDFAPFLNCGQFNSACGEAFLDSAKRIFRRPLSDEEKTLYREMTNGSLTGGDVKQGIQMALEAMLASPQFLYRHELGEPNPDNSDIASDAFELTSYEMATFLAYTYTGSTPDDALLDAAENNELRNTANILAQARRLAGSAKAQNIMGDFVGAWLGTHELDLAAKDSQAWPGFADVVPHMKEEIRRNFSYVMLDEAQSFNNLYAADFSFLNGSLAQHYGISGVNGENFRQVTTGDRGGILASGAFMARWGEAVETSPILRSVRVRRRMLCQDQPDPPAGTFAAREQKLAELSELLQDPTTTNRLKYHRLTEDAPCTNCHLQYINPLGFGMEDFDTVGRVRSQDLNGNLISALGELYAPNDYSEVDDVIAFSGTQGLAQVLADLPSAQTCVSKQIFRYVMGVGDQSIDVKNPEGPQLSDTEKAGYACEIESMTDEMMVASPRAMLENISALQAVRYRKAWSRD